MNTYLIQNTCGRPDWATIKPLLIANHQWLPRTEISAQAKLAYDAERIYVRLEATEAHIRAELRGRTCQVADDSCLEFFFCPIWGDERYFNIEMNPNGAMFVGFGSGIHDLTRLLVADETAVFAPAPFRTTVGWGVEYSVPAEFVRCFMPDFELKSGLRIRANCYKCGDQTVQPHYLSWNLIRQDTPLFHRPQDFGCMIFA